jgi:O-antigen/teichoic acid export membrane protein
LNRTKRVQATALAAIGTKVVALLTAIVSIRLTLPYLGAERYGMWMTVVSAAAMLSFSDLGMSSTVTTFIASASGGERDRMAQTYVSSAFVLLLSTAIVLIACFFLAYPFVPWASLFNVHSSKAVAEAGPTTAIFFLGTILCVPFSIVGRVQLGLQEGYKLHIWTAVGSLTTLIGVAFCARFATALGPFVMVSVFCPLLAMVCNGLSYFTKVEPQLRPRFSLFRLDVARQIAASGGIFLLQQVLSAFIYGVDGLIIVRVLGPAAVAEYSVAQRLFAMALLSQFLSLPLWPAFGDAFARGDKAWLLSSIPRSIALNVGMNFAVGIVLSVSGKDILRFWTAGAIVPGIALLIAFAFRAGQQGFDETLSAMLNHEPTMARHMVYYGAAAVASLFLKIVMCYQWGSPGVVWAGTLAFALFHALPSTNLVRKRLRTCSSL